MAVVAHKPGTDVYSVWINTKQAMQLEQVLAEFRASDQFKNHNEEFQKTVHEVSDQVKMIVLAGSGKPA